MKLSIIIIAALLAVSAPAMAVNVYTCDVKSADVKNDNVIPGTAKLLKKAAIVTATENKFMSTINNASVVSPVLDYRGFASVGESVFLMKDGQFSYGTDDFFVVLDNCVKVNS